MTEYSRPPRSFTLTDIPAHQGALILDASGKRAINTKAAFGSMAAFHDALGHVVDPVIVGEQYDDRFISFMMPYLDLSVGDTVVKNNFWLESANTWPSEFPSGDTTTIVGKLDNQKVILRNETESTGLVLVEELIESGERYIGHARARISGKEKSIRPGFWDMETLEQELEATHKLSAHGYPVPQNATAHQLFLPWVDTIIYDWIPGKDVGGFFTELITDERIDQATSIARLFGQHLKQVWQPLLDGTLPDGSVYRFPDNAIWNFIYTGEQSPREAFSRIDIGKLYGNSTPPIGSENYLEQIASEISRAHESGLGGQSRNFMDHITQGFSEG